MSAASNSIDWAGIRANAVSMGIRAAARAAAVDLPDIERERFVKRVLKRAEREEWMKAKAKAMSSAVVINEKPLSSNVVNGSDSIAKTLADDSNAIKFGLSRGIRKASERIAEMPGDEVLENADNVRKIAGSAATVHGWDAKTGDDRRTVINIGILTQ